MSQLEHLLPEHLFQYITVQLVVGVLQQRPSMVFLLACDDPLFLNYVSFYFKSINIYPPYKIVRQYLFYKLIPIKGQHHLYYLNKSGFALKCVDFHRLHAYNALLSYKRADQEGGRVFLRQPAFFYVYSLFYSPIFVVLIQELWFEHPRHFSPC